MSFHASIITLYPEMFPGQLGFSLAGNALKRGDWQLDAIPLREFGTGKHKKVDDTPAGGGAGMVLKPDVLASAIDSLPEDGRPRLLMSPRGKPLTQKMAREFANADGAVIVCGRFEGVDERVIEARNLQEISIRDYILSGGEPAAMILLDAIVRLLPGVMGNDQSGTHESFEQGLLEHPHYTRPAEWEGRTIPDVLTSGNHGAVDDWRRQTSKQLTNERRPDLYASQGLPTKIMPAMPVTDLDDGIKFYRDVLGFSCVYQDRGGYAVLQWDKVELHLWLANDESWKSQILEQSDSSPVRSGAETFIAGTHSCRIEVTGVAVHYEKLRASPHIHPNGALEKKPWGSTEFGILDPYGNLIIFFEWI